MEVIPALDLMGSDAVRLYRGDFTHTTWRRPAAEHLEHLRAAGAARVHMVDLDGARDGAIRLELVRRLIRQAAPLPVQIAGGIRTAAGALALLEAGADRVVVGTAAFATENALKDFTAAVGERLMVAVDVRAGYVTVRGWQQSTTLGVQEALRRCAEAGTPRILCTAVDRDGTLEGPDLELLEQVVAGGIPVTAAGGIRSGADIEAVAQLGCEAAVVGTAAIAHPKALLA